MRQYAIQFSPFFCVLVFILSCGSKPVINNDVKENTIDSNYINDSIAKSKRKFACDTPYSLADILIINDQTNEDDNSISFYSQIDDNGNVLSGGKPIDTSKNLFDPYIKPTNKISQKALHYLAEYIDKKCECRHPSQKDDSIRFSGGYTFRLIQNGKIKTCYVFPDNMDSVNVYLKGMRGWLKESRYKQEFKDLIEYIDYSEKISNNDKSTKISW